MRQSWISFAAVVALPVVVAGQGRPEIIRGRVTSGTAPVVEAAVAITVAPDRSIAQTRTDSAGQYSIRIANGGGDYLVHINKIGLVAFRKRVTRAGSDSIYVVDAVLAPVVQRVAAVRVEAQKPKPGRNAEPGAETGAAEKITDGVVGALSPDQIGDISAMAATVPGVTPSGAGFSVLGLDPSQNSATLNGMAFPSGSFPRAAQVNFRVSTTTYDPARGWFSGANTNIELASGSIYTSRRAFTSIDAPALQYTDPISARLGQRFTSAVGGIGGSGPIDTHDRFFYSYGAQAGRRTADASSLIDADTGLLHHAGVAADSAARLFDLLRAAHIPLAAAGIPSSQTTDNASVLMRIDRSPYDWKNLGPSKTTEAITFLGAWTRATPTSLSPTATPARANEQTQATAGLQALYSTFVGDDYLTTTRSALSVSSTHTDPYLDLPSASVLVGSSFADGTDAFSTLQFGGAGSANSNSRRWTWETMHETMFYSTARKSLHRVKVSADLRLDGYDDASAANAFGTFAFNSLGDFAVNRPSLFTRTLASPQRVGGEWNGYAALGDLWRVSPSLQLQYGARVEGNEFLQTPAYDPLLEKMLDIRNDIVPNTMHVSPRVGFTWIQRGAGNNGAITFNPMGQFHMAPTSYIRGGIGEFRNMLPATLLSDALVNTGLSGATTNITCAGASAPAPSWQSYLDNPSSIPTTCANAPGQLAENAPSVRLFDKAYSAPRSWRGNLSYSSEYKRLMYSVDGTYSLNIDQPDVTDLNLTRTASFTSGGEGRPVFAPLSAIDPSTGTVSRAASRIAPAFDQVLESSSRARSESRQIIVSASPDLFQVSHWLISASYVLASVRSLDNGFGATTFDSPLTRGWARGPLDARHAFLIQGGYTAHGVTATVFTRLASGTPFTPIVGSDVNGDGFVNDRAFIFDPANTLDRVLANGMQSLIASSTARIRNCLERQLGQPAGVRSCEGPWSSTMNASLSLSPQLLNVSKRLYQIQLALSNPLAGADLLLHGSDGLHGWGVQPFPDPTLYTVRAFDPGTRTFAYSVNPRFGSTNPALNTLRAPFRATIDITINLSPDPTVQQLERYLRPGRDGHEGARLGVDELKRRYERSVNDPYASILQESDSLLLTPDQLRAIQDVQSRFRQRMDSLWLSLATDFASLGDTFDVPAAAKRQEGAIADGLEIARRDVQLNLPKILSPIQLSILPSAAARFYRATEPLARGGTFYP